MSSNPSSSFPPPPVWIGSAVPSRADVADALYCPFPPTRNPNLEPVHIGTSRWVERAHLHADRAREERAIEARMAVMIAGFYPIATLPKLRIASDYLAWAFALDDAGDETSLGERPGRLMRLFERYDAVLRGETPLPTDPPSVPALLDVLTRLREHATPEQMEAFIEGNRAYFGAMLWEANNRASKYVPDEIAFELFRPAAGAVPPFFALIEPMEDIVLPAEVKADPTLVKLARIAGLVACFINDALSYEKERVRGEMHNLAFVYERHRGLSPGAALAQCVARTNAAVRDFVLEQRALGSYGEHDEAVRKYVATLASVMRVTLDWTLESSRYGVR
jgi:hypothetical protein